MKYQQRVMMMIGVLGKMGRATAEVNEAKS